ncbi:heparinase II/III family protein [Candidatus Bathyarchaeota archaeon]|nr:heparinase II/III family protein [Candidatus Bathyarchaeota archaeon]MBS7617276.1 heparinase II/III family protein [Candidatus Bathyarchaeota archaeon]
MQIPNLHELEKLIRKPNIRPLLLADIGDFETLRSRMMKNRWRKTAEKLLKHVDKLLNDSIPQLPRSLYDDFFRTGRRHVFEEPYFLRRRAVEDLTLAYIFTGKDTYLDRCRDYIWAIMEEFTWVIPAHAKTPFQPGEECIVDLFSSGTAMLLADIWDLLYNDLDGETLEWIRYNILRRALIPLRDHYDEQWWSRSYESNWCGVCAGNSGCALILVALDESWSIDLLHKILKSIDGFLSTADPDGAWVEGVGYWFYGFSRVFYFSDLLAKVTDGRINLLEDPRIKASITFPVWMYLPPRSQVNFGDTGSTPSVYMDVLNLILKCYKEPSIAWYIQRLEEEGLLNGGSLRELIWEPAEVEPIPPKQTFKWYRRIGVIVTRSSWNDLDVPILAVKAGHNAEPHNHIDVGQFIYHCYGNSFICDLGVGIYDRDYFGFKRYENPICGADGHNLIFVDGRSQAVGRDYKGEIVEFKCEKDWELIKLDLTKTYSPDVLSKAIRTFVFLKHNGLILVDEVMCRENALVETRLHFKGDFQQTQHWVDMFTEKGRVRVQPKDPSTKVTIETHRGLKTRDTSLINAQYIRLIKWATGGYAKIQVYMIPYRTTVELNVRLIELEKKLSEIEV